MREQHSLLSCQTAPHQLHNVDGTQVHECIAGVWIQSRARSGFARESFTAAHTPDTHHVIVTISNAGQATDLISHYSVKVERGQNHRQQLPAPPLMQRPHSILRSTCLHSFDQAFTRDQVLAFAKSLTERSDFENRIIEWKKHDAH
jgi:hypothetical protein